MINMITETIGSTYWVNEVTANLSVKNKAQVNYKDKLSQVAHLEKIKNLNKLKAKKEEINEEGYFKTKMTINEEGECSIVLVTNNKGYREINLDGGKTEKIINPVRARKAYFGNE